MEDVLRRLPEYELGNGVLSVLLSGKCQQTEIKVYAFRAAGP